MSGCQPRSRDGKFAQSHQPAVPPSAAAATPPWSPSWADPQTGQWSPWEDPTNDPVTVAYRAYLMHQTLEAATAMYPDLFSAGGKWYVNDVDPEVQERVYLHPDEPGRVVVLRLMRREQGAFDLLVSRDGNPAAVVGSIRTTPESGNGPH